MTIGRAMLQAARRARALLADPDFGDRPAGQAAPSRAAAVAEFLRGRQRPDGGFADRSGKSDLYYTVFGLQGLLSVDAPFDASAVAGYLRPFGDGEGLDLVHLACLARAWACLCDATGGSAGRATPQPSLTGLRRESHGGPTAEAVGYPHTAPTGPGSAPAAPRGTGAGTGGGTGVPPVIACGTGVPPVHDPAAAIRRRLEGFRTTDGGYSHQPGSPTGSIYGCFLALGTCEDLGTGSPDPQGLVRCVEACRAPDGGYANEPGLPMSLVPTTAAAAAVLHELGRPVAPVAAEWLMARHAPQGGFRAAGSPNAVNRVWGPHFAPAPDLLSTATALHALGTLGVDLSGIRDACRSFILSLQSPAGGFVGQAGDATPDCEYTFYALLGLGRLA